MYVDHPAHCSLRDSLLMWLRRNMHTERMRRLLAITHQELCTRIFGPYSPIRGHRNHHSPSHRSRPQTGYAHSQPIRMPRRGVCYVCIQGTSPATDSGYRRRPHRVTRVPNLYGCASISVCTNASREHTPRKSILLQSNVSPLLLPVRYPRPQTNTAGIYMRALGSRSTGHQYSLRRVRGYACSESIRMPRRGGWCLCALCAGAPRVTSMTDATTLLPTDRSPEAMRVRIAGGTTPTVTLIRVDDIGFVYSTVGWLTINVGSRVCYRSAVLRFWIPPLVSSTHQQLRRGMSGWNDDAQYAQSEPTATEMLITSTPEPWVGDKVYISCTAFSPTENRGNTLGTSW